MGRAVILMMYGDELHMKAFSMSKDGNFRCPNSQQGYSGFTTWTRGLAWAMCGFAEELEWIDAVKEEDLRNLRDKERSLWL